MIAVVHVDAHPIEIYLIEHTDKNVQLLEQAAHEFGTLGDESKAKEDLDRWPATLKIEQMLEELGPVNLKRCSPCSHVAVFRNEW